MCVLKYLMVVICLSLYCSGAALAQGAVLPQSEGGITIAWTANTESDLKGYKVYYGTSSGFYDNSVDVKNVTLYTIRNLKVGVKYYIAVTAHDTWGNESGYSVEVTTTAKDIVFPKAPINVREATTNVTPP